MRYSSNDLDLCRAQQSAAGRNNILAMQAAVNRIFSFRKDLCEYPGAAGRVVVAHGFSHERTSPAAPTSSRHALLLTDRSLGKMRL